MLAGMKLAELLKVLRAIAPEDLAEPWDKVGLHVGDPAQDAAKALLCIDLTEPVMAEAVEQGVSLVVAYHPPIFKPLERLTRETWKERVMHHAIRHGIAVYSPHTALDAATGGVNDWLADALGAGTRRPIKPHARQSPRPMKLVTFVPEDAADPLRAALSDAGAGRIGDYTECSFSVKGEGTFRGGEGANPTIGERGRFERVPELRMEMVLPVERVSAVVEALRRVHPYEEPAFDLLPLAAPPEAEKVGQGVGRVVELEAPIALDDLVARYHDRLGGVRLEVGRPREPRPIRRVGLCPGAGGSLLDEAAAAGVDAFVTGEMRHHDMLDAVERGIAIVLAGHTQTERPYLPTYRERLIAAGGEGIDWVISRADVAPTRG